MMSVQMQEVHDWAKEYDSKLRADDSRLARAVTIIHEEGTVLHFRSAFVLKRRSYGIDWYCVFTEHHSFYVYAADDVKVIQFSGEKKIEKAP